MEKNQKIQRRSFLVKTGLVSAGALSAVATQTVLQPQEAHGQTATWPYPFVTLDPNVAAQRGYDAFYQGACCYGAAYGILSQWQELAPETFGGVPADMFKYGEGGITGWGSACGTLIGASAMINLVTSVEEARALINELVAWYADTAVPVYIPAGSEAITKSTSNSPLCHVSVSKWCKAAGAGAVSAERKERCGRLVADVAMKTATILNDHFDEKFVAEHGVSPITNDCMACHGSSGLNTTLGKMECTPCHLPENHPVPISDWSKL